MITYSQAEFLLDHYNSISARAKNASYDMRKLVAYKHGQQKDDLIEGLVLRPYDTTKTIVQTSAVADMTVWIALNYRKINRHLFADTEKQIIEEAVAYGGIAEKVRNAMRGLKPVEAKIIRLYHFNSLTYAQLARRVKYVPDHCRRIRREAVEKLCKLITLDDLERQYLATLTQEGTA